MQILTLSYSKLRGYIRYFLQDKAGYSYYAYTKITVDNIYGVTEGSKYETLWKKV